MLVVQLVIKQDI